LVGSGTLFELRVKQMNNGSREAELKAAKGPGRFLFIDRELKAHSPGIQ